MHTFAGTCHGTGSEPSTAVKVAPGASSRKKKFLVAAVAFPLAVASSGCANVPKATSMSVAGAMAGAAAGSRYGVEGMIVGAVVGGAIGNRIGDYFDEEDRKKLAALEMKALETGKAASFVTNKSGIMVTITPEPPKMETVQSLALPSDVEEKQLKAVAPQAVNAFVDTPVFASLNEKSAPRRTIKKGETINISAHIEGDGKWGAVVEADTVVGYVPLRYLNKKIVAQVKHVKVKSPAKTAAKAPAPVAKSDATAIAASGKGADGKQQAALSSKPAETPVRTVAVVGACKPIVIQLDPAKADAKETRKWCQVPPPQWKLVTA